MTHVTPNPLLVPPRFKANLPVDVKMRFIDSHLFHEQAALDAIQARRDAAAAEYERQNAPHPMTQPPYSAIPIPDRGKK